MNELINFIKKDISHHFLLPAASEGMIAECEEILGIKLPNSYTEFLKFSNGALLYESDELFGTHKINEGVGSLIEARSYKIAELLPDQFILFHDDGFECHAFEISSAKNGEYSVIHWNPNKHVVVRSYRDLSEWVKAFLVRKWSGEGTMP